MSGTQKPFTSAYRGGKQPCAFCGGRGRLTIAVSASCTGGTGKAQRLADALTKSFADDPASCDNCDGTGSVLVLAPETIDAREARGQITAILDGNVPYPPTWSDRPALTTFSFPAITLELALWTEDDFRIVAGRRGWSVERDSEVLLCRRKE